MMSASARSLGSPRVANEQVHARLNAAAADDRSPPPRSIRCCHFVLLSPPVHVHVLVSVPVRAITSSLKRKTAALAGRRGRLESELPLLV